jgi:hypothetical protein
MYVFIGTFTICILVLLLNYYLNNMHKDKLTEKKTYNSYKTIKESYEVALMLSCIFQLLIGIVFIIAGIILNSPAVLVGIVLCSLGILCIATLNIKEGSIRVIKRWIEDKRENN